MQTESRRSTWKAVLLFIAFVITFQAAYSLRNDDYPLFSLTLLAFIVGSVLFVLGSPHPVPWRDLPPMEGMSNRQLWVITASFLFSIASFILFWYGRGTNEQFTGLPLFLWLLSLLNFCVGVGLLDKSPSVEGEKISKVEILLLVLIFSGALFLRTYRLDVFPNGCQTDECKNGLDALKLLTGKPYTPYSETNEGQATLFTYLLAVSFKFFGVGVIQMRLVSAVIGTLTIVAFYFLARDWLEWRFALTATALFAVARWHLTFSRIIYELILTPLAEILVFLFLLRALKNGRARDWALSGLCLAFGMNTYTGFRVIPILIAVYLIHWIIAHYDRLRRDAQGILYFALGAWVGMTPLTVYILQKWNVFMGRTRHISILNDVANAGGSLQPLWENITRTILSFHWEGDWSALNNLPGEPLLDIVVGILVLFGLAYAIRYIGHPLGFLYVTWAVAGLSLAVLSSVSEAPTARRPIGLLPLIFLMSGMVLQLASETWQNVLLSSSSAPSEKFRRLLSAVESLLLGIVFFVVGVINVNTFYIQARTGLVWRAYNGIEAAIGEYLRDLPDESQVYLDSAFKNHSTITFISQARPYTILNLSRHIPVMDIPSPPADVTYVLSVHNGQVEPVLEQIYPEGRWEVHKDPSGVILFFTFEVPAIDLIQANGIVGKYYSGHEIVGKPLITRLDPSLDFQWETTDAPPLPAPFSSQWSGAIFFPDGYGEYEFAIRTDGNAELSLDGKPVLGMVPGGVGTNSMSAPLAGGFHNFEITYHSGTAPGELTLLWKNSNSDFEPIPDFVFFNTIPARNGLTGYYYPNENRAGPPSLIQNDLFVLPNDLLSEKFSIVWKGKVEILENGEYVFGTFSDDGSYVHVDGHLVVDGGGSHAGVDAMGKIFLEKGLHDLEIHYWQLGGAKAMKFWWQPPGMERMNVPLEHLFPQDVRDDGNP